MSIQHKKGQVAVLDLFISAMIFSIIVTAVMFTWSNYSRKIDEQIDSNTDLLRAYHISDLLTKYPGKPTSWDKYDVLGNQSVSVIGLANEDRIIDPGKLSSFINLDYAFIKNKLGINQYDFYFRLTNLDGSDFNPKIEKGNKTNESSTITLKRYVIYNGTETILEFQLQK